MKKLLLALAVVLAYTGSAFAADHIVEVVNPTQVFEKGYIQVIGESEAGQSRYRAKRAAEVVAQRRLLEIVQGLNLSGESTVRDGMLENDKIKSTVQGFLRGATPCGESYDRSEKYARVCLRLDLHGSDSVYSAFEKIITKEPEALKVRSLPAFTPEKSALPDLDEVLKEQPVIPAVENDTAPAETPVETPAKVETPIKAVDGIIIDVRDFDFKPALVNRILTDKNEVLFDPSKVVNQVLIERGCGGYTTDLQKAKALLSSWGSSSPMVIKGETVKNVTDAVVNADDAARVFVSDQKNNILAQAKVVFVLK